MTCIAVKEQKRLLGRQRGMTLVEIMISLLIGAFLLAGILQIFIGTRQSYRMQENLSQLQENGRFAMEFLSKDIRMGGFTGCPSLGTLTPNFIATPKNPNPNPAINPFTNLTAISGANNIAANWSVGACSAASQCVANTDAITLQFAGSCGGKLTGNMGTNNANIQIGADNTCDIKKYDVVLISDCSAADVFVETSNDAPNTKQTIAHANDQNSDNKLSKIYGPDAEVYKFYSYSYFIRTGASGLPALWRIDNTKAVVAGSNPIELLEGIENMQIVYGEDTDADGTANYYVPANSIVNTGNIIGIRIEVLAVSPDDNLAAQPISYSINGGKVDPVDKRLRRVFTSTLAVRNRLK